MGSSQSQEEIQYCYPIPNSKEPGFTPIFRNPQFKDQLTTTPDPNVRTYRDVVVQSFSKKFVNNKAAGTSFLIARQNHHQKDHLRRKRSRRKYHWIIHLQTVLWKSRTAWKGHSRSEALIHWVNPRNEVRWNLRKKQNGMAADRFGLHSFRNYVNSVVRHTGCLKFVVLS